jgi:hypothetical protein
VREFANLPRSCYEESCDILVLAFFRVPSTYTMIDRSYFNLGKAFITIPILGFVVSIIACWVINGFRQSTQLGEPPQVSQDEHSDGGK